MAVIVFVDFFLVFETRMSEMLNCGLGVLGKKVVVRCFMINCQLGHAYRACL